MGDVGPFLKAIPEAAKSPYALIAYAICAVVAIASLIQARGIKNRRREGMKYVFLAFMGALVVVAALAGLALLRTSADRNRLAVADQSVSSSGDVASGARPWPNAPDPSEIYAPDTYDRAGLIVTFLALLEMIRLKLVRVFQSGSFGPIRVYKRARPADAPHPIGDPEANGG